MSRSFVSFIAPLAVTALLLGACSTQGPATSAKRGEADAVRSARAAQNRAIAALDTAAVARFWTEDVEIRPLAYEEGTWIGHLGRADGAALIAGRYAAQWVKRGEHWLIRGEVYVALTCSGAGCTSMAVT